MSERMCTHNIRSYPLRCPNPHVRAPVSWSNLSALSDPLILRPTQMLFAAQSMMFQAAAGLVAAPLAARSVERAAAPSMAVGLVYSTTTGNTETVAGYIAGETGLSAVDIADLTGEGVAAFDGALRLSDYPASHLPAWPGPACSARRSS